jgi:hypothetical protein
MSILDGVQVSFLIIYCRDILLFYCILVESGNLSLQPIPSFHRDIMYVATTDQLTLRFCVVRITLLLRFKPEVFMGRSEEHFSVKLS